MGLTLRSDRERVAFLIKKVLKPLCLHVATPCTAWSIIGPRKPGDKDRALAAFSLEILVHQDVHGLVAAHENPSTSSLWKEFESELGCPQNPKGNWHWSVVNGCSYGLTSPGVDEIGIPMQKTFRVVVNRPTHFGNRCRESLVSPMTRARVLSPEEAAMLVVQECSDAPTGECLPERDDGLGNVGEAPGRPRRSAGFPVFFIRPGGQIEVEDEQAVELEAPDPGYTVDPRLEAVARARWMVKAAVVTGARSRPISQSSKA